MCHRTACTLKHALAAWMAGLVGAVAAVTGQAVPAAAPIDSPAWYAALVALALAMLPWIAGGVAGGFARSAWNSGRGKPAWGKQQLRDTLLTAVVIGTIAGALSASLLEEQTAQWAVAALFGIAAPEFGAAWIRTAEENPSAIWRWFRGGRSGGPAP